MPGYEPQVGARILRATGAEAIQDAELIQPLWNDYGTLCRLRLLGGEHASVIVKHIQIPEAMDHPRGFASSISRDRKVRSYEVETQWYQVQNRLTPEGSPTPRCLDAFAEGGELFLLLEDLGPRGFTKALLAVAWPEICVALRWLASFHAGYLEDVGEGLWGCGTYWHLETRPEELRNIEGTRLHQYASLLDARLRCGAYPTLVHGDAKLANFLFTKDHQQVAAVDFQYVGRGAAMRDVAYFVGSCLEGAECERRERELLDVYFEALRPCLPDHVDSEALEVEWRSLYPVAWADFERFMVGWSPGHRKLTDYSDATTERAIDGLLAELMEAAREAAMAAGRHIQVSRKRRLKVGSKGLDSRAADVVTEVDLEAQAIILDRLAEEGVQDESRLVQHAFWAIDPLDGTQWFLEGDSGYATSIALVNQAGETLLGVVVDPVGDRVFEVVKGRGVRLNGAPLSLPITEGGPSERVRWFADRSLRDHPRYAELEAAFDVRFVGGAVSNGLAVLMQPNSVYIKEPRTSVGGCAIWDLAAVTLMVEEAGGSVGTYEGDRLDLNRPESPFFHEVGFALGSPGVALEEQVSRVKATAVLLDGDAPG